jgi:hypothetical protein
VAGGAVVGFLGALLFGCAGRSDLLWFWAYLTVWAAAALVAPLVMESSLMEDRPCSGRGHAMAEG